MKDQILLAAINVTIIISLLFLILTGVEYYYSTNFNYNLNFFIIAEIALLHFIALTNLAYAWKFLLQTISQISMPFSACLEQTALMLLSKYIPGKVWGILVRALLAKKHHFSASMVVNSSLFELFFSLFVSASLGVFLFYLSSNFILLITMIILLIFIGKYFICYGFNNFIVLFSKIPVVKNKLNLNQYQVDFSLNEYIKLLTLYTTQWFVISIIIHLSLIIIGIEVNFIKFAMINGAFMLATVSGFIVFFIPGGLVIREGMIIFFTKPIIGLENAIQLSVLLRLWNISFDIFSASIGITLYYRNRNQIS